MATQVVAYNVAKKAWPTRAGATTAAVDTPVLWAGPLDAPTPPTKGTNDLELAQIIRDAIAASGGGSHGGY